MNIKILDCTLRDGGYVNDWEFGKDTIKSIIKNLIEAKIDYIEVGFLKNTDENTEEKSIFTSIDDINRVIVENKNKSQILAMIIYGKYDISNIKKSNVLDAIRVTFKSNEIDDAISYLSKIKDMGYKIFANPTNVDSYSDYELLEIIRKINKLKPYGFSIVDTKGILHEKDINRLFHLIDNNLDKDIALCFHSHNNLQLSFSNAQVLMKYMPDRELIIDSSVFGMGRGAGNLSTELLMQYINDNYSCGYNILPILNIVDEHLNKIFAKTPWGYSLPYYLAAVNKCHPNYASYLLNKETLNINSINYIIKNIPKDKKNTFNKELINELYFKYQEHYIDDKNNVNNIINILNGKKILILAPGKSLITDKAIIDNFITTSNPFIISLNFIPENLKIDLVFVSNMKRYNSIKNTNINKILTSNIKLENNKNEMIINYSNYINDSYLSDNTALMLIKFLISININEINIAGLDGFSKLSLENYASEQLINTATNIDFNEKNNIMSEELKKLKKYIKINFITNTFYNI